MDQNSCQTKPLFTFLHFNDVYDIQPKKNGTAGAVNFQAYLRKLKVQNPDAMIVFSGDAFSPSTLTNIFEGAQMVTALNKLNIDVACMGNHQFDLDYERTIELFGMCNFPWMQGNIQNVETGQLLGKGLTHFVKEVKGRRIGFYGVAGEDWLGIMGDRYELAYRDVYQFSEKISKMLRQEENCDIVVGLTHMRVVQDKQLPEKSEGVDIVLGGHDHIIMEQFINKIPVIKSGSNFKNLSLIKVYQKGLKENVKYQGRRFDFDIQKHLVPIIEEGIDEQLNSYVEKCVQQYEKYDRLVGYTDVYLDTRFSRVRTMETNYGNFLADLVRTHYDTDCCLLNSGCIRNDVRIKPGKLNFSVVSNLINDVLVVKQVSGKIILEALQYAVSSLPDCFSGSFLLVSGMKYAFDYRKKPKIQEVFIQGKPLDLKRNYSVAMKFYISIGGDGFNMWKQCPYLIDVTRGIQTLTLLLNFFKASEVQYDTEKIDSLRVENKMMPAKFEEKQNQSQIIEADEEVYELPSELLHLTKRASTQLDRLSKLRARLMIGPQGKKYVCIGPKLDGRIRSLAEEQKINQTQILPF